MKKMINEGRMMKKVITLLVFLFLLIPFAGQAHTALTSSNPEAGQLLDKQPEQIELTFGTEIEEGSSLTLQGPEGTVNLEGISISGNKMSAPLTGELEGGEYVIDWEIIGADGHLIEGEIPFSLELPASEEPAVEPDIEESATEQDEEPAGTDGPIETTTAATAEETGLLTTGLIVLLVILAAIAIRLFLKKKR